MKKDNVENPKTMLDGRNQLRQPSKYKDLRIGTWNVLSLYRSHALRNLTDIIQTYKVDIVTIQEVRWTGQSIMGKKECMVYYSCHKRLQQFGTGFIVSKKVSDLVIVFQPINMRIRKLRLKDYMARQPRRQPSSYSQP
jgi:exonuclease III